MSGPIALVTGASTGIGRAIAARLAGAGFTVYGTSRNPGTVTALPGVTFLPLDVTDQPAVKHCVQAVLDKAGRIDVLVNNAGIAVVGAIEEVPVELAWRQFETNYFGVVRMIQAVLPGMRQRGSGHIINVGSVSGLLPIPFAGQYSASKYAIEGLSEALRAEVARFGIKVAVVEPGFFKSDLVGSALAPDAPLEAYRVVRERVHDRIRQIEAAAEPPGAVADRVLQLARDPDPPLRSLIGKEKIFAVLKRFLPFALFEPSGRRFWGLN